VILVAAINTSFAYADFDTNRFGQGSILWAVFMNQILKNLIFVYGSFYYSLKLSWYEKFLLKTSNKIFIFFFNISMKLLNIPRYSLVQWFFADKKYGSVVSVVNDLNLL
jgi:hypothetical protein